MGPDPHFVLLSSLNPLHLAQHQVPDPQKRRKVYQELERFIQELTHRPGRLQATELIE